jgi:predicted small lipoprotein YifL
VTGVRSAVVIVALALSLVGCGRKSGLEPPPGTPAAPIERRADGSVSNLTTSSSLQRPVTSNVEVTEGPLLRDVVRPKRPFLLDFLL